MSEHIIRKQLLFGLDTQQTTGIEIGPLTNPVLRKDSSNVKYVDRASTEQLKEWFANDDKLNINDIMDIDYVWGKQSLSEATSSTESFDYCIASHVIEHIPDLITWLKEIASILKPGGTVCFVVPDKRYTFDVLRPLTTTADLVDSYLNRLRKPSFRHIYDHFSNFTELDISIAWKNDFDSRKLAPSLSSEEAYAACLEAKETDKYVDSHCSVFTQFSFIELLNSLANLGLLDFKFKRLFSLNSGSFEFVVHLEKIDAELTQDEKLNQFKDSLIDVKPQELTVAFECDHACLPKLFFNLDNSGFNNIQLIIRSYNTPNKTVELVFPIPNKLPIDLRFDPSDNAGEFKVHSIKLHRPDGISTNIPLSNVTKLNEIDYLKIKRKKLIIKTDKGANDPALKISL